MTDDVVFLAPNSPALVGKKIEIKDFELIRLADGKAVEQWGLTDTMMMMQQLGAIPMPGK